MEHTKQEKGKVFKSIEVADYIANSVVLKKIMEKTTGNVSVLSFDSGMSQKEKVSPFDVFIQIIHGSAEIIINELSHLVEKGQGIIIPAHSRHIIKANVKFKMISTLIKSGYEDVS
jgi:quercetin dioxygenase-like cupin family protein